MGHDPLVAPLLTIVPVEAVMPGGRFEAVVATSANAFSAPVRAQAKQWTGAPLLAVGERTAAAARASGFDDICCAPDAHSLVQLAEERLGKGARVLYLAGLDRKLTIEAALRKTGHEVVVLETYKAKVVAALPDPIADGLRGGEIDAVLHYSKRSALAFCRLAEQAGVASAAARLLHCCISGDAALPLAAIAAEHIAVAEEPSEPALLATLPPPAGRKRRDRACAP
jgi:uroporphyrinogen-III synthase